MTVTYTLSNQSAWQDNELKYSIRSFVKYTDVSRIIIIGHLPGFLQNVEYIPFDDGPRKQLNIHLKTLAACDLCDDFIQAADDHFVLEPIDFSTYYYDGDLREKKYENKYAIPLANTLKELPLGKFYNLHIPMRISSFFYRIIMQKYDWETKDFLIKSLYANNLKQVYSKQSHDVKVSRFMRREAIDKFVSDKKFLSVSDAGLSVDMKSFLSEKFPVKSIYER
jgi:hypothetical protein